MSKTSVDFKSQVTNPDLPQVKDIMPDELRDKKDLVKIVDVRRPDEYVGEFGHIPGAELLTLDDLPAKINKLPKDKTIVFVCRSGGRSARATAFALENGFHDVFNMQGGMIAWTNKKFEAEDKK